MFPLELKKQLSKHFMCIYILFKAMKITLKIFLSYLCSESTMQITLKRLTATSDTKPSLLRAMRLF